MPRIKVGTRNDFDGSPKSVVVDGTVICLAAGSDGELYAFEDRCSHEETPLSGGEVLGMSIVCPMHGSEFDLRTGKVTGLPADQPIRVFPVSLDGADVVVDL
jgi:3-phenylpropionate/trans-cinnamate dioxygenase ferredoxin subunit